MTSRIKLGASLGRWDESDIIDQLRDMAGVVDAATVFPYPFNMPVASQLLREVHDVGQDLGLILLVHGPIWEVYTASIYPKIRSLAVDMVQRSMDFAAEIGAVHITLHPGSNQWPDVWPQLHAQALEAQMRSFVELGTYAYEVGLQVGIENMLPGASCLKGYENFSEIFRVLEQVPGMGVTLDVGHVQVLGMDPEQIIGRLGSRLNHVHVHDNHGQWDEHLPVGEGSIHWGQLCRALLDIDYSGVLEIERSLADGGVQLSVTRLRRALAAAQEF